jgi:hypothetical protein
MKSMAAAVVLLSLTLVAPVSAQDVLFSKKVTGTNIAPRQAVNETTGDVLVTWNRIAADATTSEVWGALWRRSKDGSFGKPRKARLLSSAKGYNANARAVWLADEKAYLVVWDTWRVPGSPADILGRVVKKNGKPKGAVLTLVADGGENYGAVPSPGAPANVTYVSAPVIAQRAGPVVRINRLEGGFDPDTATVVDAFVASDDSAFAEEFFETASNCRVLVVQQGTAFSDSPSVHVLLMQGDAVVDQVQISFAVLVASAPYEGPSTDLALFVLPANADVDRDPTLFNVRIAPCKLISRDDGLRIPRAAVENAFRATVTARALSSERRSDTVLDLITALGDELQAMPFSAADGPSGDTATLATGVDGALFVKASSLPAPKKSSAASPDLVVSWLVAAKRGNEIRGIAARRQ